VRQLKRSTFFVCSIIYRDIKPSINIGFDVRGDKILISVSPESLIPRLVDKEDGTYKLTGDTGSPRYMATEVALCKPYNERAMCTLLFVVARF
jgi:hypothetical protein